MGSFGPSGRNLENSAGATSIPVASTATVYTKAIPLTLGRYFALSYKATSDGDVDLKIELEQSHKLPTTEGASDASYVVGEGISDIETNLTDEFWHHASVSPIPVKYGRLKITGQGTNHASTVIEALLSIQEQA